MADIFSAENGKRMAALEVELAIVLRRANDQKLEAAVAAFACIRLARQLLDKYPTKSREALVDVVVAFLKREGDLADAGTLLM